MGRQTPHALIFDAGALIAFEAGDRRVATLLQRAKDLGRRVIVPAAVLAQVWRRRGPRQARLALLLNAKLVQVEDLTKSRAQLAGELCGRSETRDIVAASVVVAAWAHGRIVVTSDAGDLRRLDPSLTYVEV